MKRLPTIGSILLAEPFLKDEYFIRSVVLLADFSPKGAFGFILNRPIDFSINEAFDNFPKFNCNLFLGGPVQRDHVFYLHTKPQLFANSKQILDNLYWGGDFEVLKKEIEKGNITEHDIRFFAGYSGWESGQLEREIKEKSWIITQTSSEVIFKTPPHFLWKKLLTDMGPGFAEMAGYPIDPSLN